MKHTLKAGGPNRLSDITVEEVSLVDRAANNRTFLLVKRSDAMLNGDEALDLIELEAEGEESPEEGDGSETENEGDAEKTPSDPWAPVLEVLTGIATKLEALTPVAVSTEEAKPRPKPAEPTDDTLKPRPKPSEPTDPKLRTVLKQLSDAVTMVAEAVKGQAARLTKLEKSTPGRNSVEESAARESAPVGWPLDMNRPTERHPSRRGARFHEVSE